MKIIFVILGAISLMAGSSTFAYSDTGGCTGKEYIGNVSVTGASSLESLTSALADRAYAQGASCITIISAGGKNHMFGVAKAFK